MAVSIYGRKRTDYRPYHWTLYTVLQAFLYVLMTFVAVVFSTRIFGIFIIFPLIGMLATTINTMLTGAALCLGFPESCVSAPIVERLFVTVPLGLILEAFFFLYIRPLIHTQYLEIYLAIVKDIRIGRDYLLLSFIQVLHANDHYVDVITADKTRMIRARLSDCLSQIEETDGVVPHRSYWVARTAIKEIDLRADVSQLVRFNGTVVPIASGRRITVQNWAERNSIKVTIS